MKSESRRWIPFVILSMVYIVFSVYVSFDRSINVDERLFGEIGKIDYLIHTVLGDAISKGASPWSSWACKYVDHNGVEYGLYPRMFVHYLGGTLFNAGLIRLTGLSSEFVVFSLGPAITNIVMVVAIYIACRMLYLTPKQSFFFFVLFCFLNDEMIFRATYGSGEHLSTAIGLIGVIYFIKGKYYRSILPIVISCVMHPTGIGRFAILGMWVFLSTIHTFVNDNFSFRRMFKMKNFKNPYIAQMCSLGIIALVIGMHMYPVFTIMTCHWTDAITGEARTKVVKSRADLMIECTDARKVLPTWYLPQNLEEVVRSFTYPISYFYVSFLPRVSLNSTLFLFGYNLTLAEVENLRQFNLNTPIQVMMVPLIYGFGIPLLFLLVVRECIKTRDSDKILLSVSAYLLMILFTIGYYITGVAIYPQRFVRVVGEFWILVLIGSDVINPNTRIKRTIMWVLSVFLAIRFIVFILSVINIWGL